MIGETLALLGAMYGAIGPGFLLALGLPLFLVALVWVARVVGRQLRS
jgi:hypothetical protein